MRGQDGKTSLCLHVNFLPKAQFLSCNTAHGALNPASLSHFSKYQCPYSSAGRAPDL